MTTPEQPEALDQLLARAAEGDEFAWRTIIEQYERRVYGLIRAQCGNSDLAEEITQSTFCTVVSKIGGYTEQGRFESWLFRIAMNRLRDEMRRRRRQAIPVEGETLTGLAGADEGSPPPGQTGERGGAAIEAAGLGEGQLNALRRAMQQLGEADRTIIHLRHHAGLSFKQISDLLDEPLGTVLARQHRALRKLKDLMGESADDSGWASD
jgi:RNA polymerase sigma-70 factor (ECF subfamily)